jgi:hypothetical protein
MQMSSPKAVTWWVAVVLGVLGLIGSFVAIPVISAYAFWLVFLGFLLLAVASVVNGL